jgi:hypothetical protein
MRSKFTSDEIGAQTRGIRDRALRAALARGPQPEDPEATGQTLARAEQDGVRLGRLPASEIVIKLTPLPTPHLTIVTTKISDPYSPRRFQTFALNDSTGEVADFTSFVSVAVALMHPVRAVTRRAMTEPQCCASAIVSSFNKQERRLHNGKRRRLLQTCKASRAGWHDN